MSRLRHTIVPAVPGSFVHEATADGQGGWLWLKTAIIAWRIEEQYGESTRTNYPCPHPYAITGNEVWDQASSNLFFIEDPSGSFYHGDLFFVTDITAASQAVISGA